MKRFKDFLVHNSITFEENISLASKTWLKTGGVVKMFICPCSIMQLKDLLVYCKSEKIDYEIIGYTTNIYYVDTYNPNIIISTTKIRKFHDFPDYIYCECGVPVSQISVYSVEKGYIGYSGLVNLPGTVGAAICNNSSCFDCSISEHLLEVDFFNLRNGKFEKLQPSKLGYSHRNSNIKNGYLQGVVLSVKLSKKQGDISIERTKSEKARQIRRKTQETAAFTLGSIFVGLKERRCIKNQIVRIGGGVLRRLHFFSDNNNKLRLAIFGYIDLFPFVSSKTINTFKWLKDRSDKHEKFVRYTEFIKKAYESPILEIEVRQ